MVKTIKACLVSEIYLYFNVSEDVNVTMTWTADRRRLRILLQDSTGSSYVQVIVFTDSVDDAFTDSCKN